MNDDLPDYPLTKEEPEEDKPLKVSYHALPGDDPLDNEGPAEYYLQTVKVGEEPQWQLSEDDLDVFSQHLDNNLIQYWAYPKTLGKTATDIPHAEVVANKNRPDNPVVIIDQVQDQLNHGILLELILARGGHALAKTDSNLDNLEANITSLLDLGKKTFGLSAEHFISTSNVSPEVEKRLDDLEEAEDQQQTAVPEEPTSTPTLEPAPKMPELIRENKSSKLVVLLPIIILVLVFGGAIFYRDKLLAKFMSVTNPPKQVAVEVTPTPSPTPTPVTVDRSKFTVRVLNGTPTTGAAGVLADKLKAKGWLIDRTGNATSSAILESFIRGKPGTDDAIKTLLADVSDYAAASSSSSLKSTDKADLEFVIGKK